MRYSKRCYTKKRMQYYLKRKKMIEFESEKLYIVLERLFKEIKTHTIIQC